MAGDAVPSAGCARDGTFLRRPLHQLRVLPIASLNRGFVAIYSIGLLALFYRHAVGIITGYSTFASLILRLVLLMADATLAFTWTTTQAFRMRPVQRREFPENLPEPQDYLRLDVFICTADPYKEPPMGVADTALSFIAYDYPPEKLTVYVSDDGGSELTLFALMEAANFARHWLPFCQEKNLVSRNPEKYFRSCKSWCTRTEKIKMLYDNMKDRVESSVESGRVSGDHLTTHGDRRVFFDAFRKEDFSRRHHPTVVRILTDGENSAVDASIRLPKLVYVSREKNPAWNHHFKAGALNALLRVSGMLTNAPVILTVDCDTYSNDPATPRRALCYIMDPVISRTLAYVQFPQKFHGINTMDTYACELKRLFHINSMGMDGLDGPNYVGAGTFFRRRAFFGPPSPADKIVDVDFRQRVGSSSPLASVADCGFEDNTEWGSSIGFRYGSLVEDYYTGYRMQCEGWKSVFCNPDRAAFLGDSPINLNDMMSQIKRWMVGLLEVILGRYSTVTYGLRSMGPLMALCYSHYGAWPFAAIPVGVYAFLPQLALVGGVFVFPKSTDPWFLLYAFLFLAAYGQDLLDFVLAGGTAVRWWSDQRMWVVRGLTSFLFGLLEYFATLCGIQTHGFNVTSKVVDDEQRKRYEMGLFEFGVASPMFVPLTAAALVNAVALLGGLRLVFAGVPPELLAGQLCLTGFLFLNFWPVYEAIVLRSDPGRMHPKITAFSAAVVCALLVVTYLLS